MYRSMREKPLEIEFRIRMPLWLAARLATAGVCVGCLDDNLDTEVCEVCGTDHKAILDAIDGD